MSPYASGPGWTLYHGDCREVLPTLAPVDCILTDPPYSDRTHSGARRGAGNSAEASCPMDIDFAPTTPDGLREIFGMIWFRRWLVSFMDYRMVPALEDAPPTGVRGVRMGVWTKPNGAPQFTGDRPAQGWEAIWIAHALGDCAAKMRWNGGGYPAVWSCNVERSELTGHPTQKPLPLVKELVTLFSDEGETILDPFAGSGTTLVAARDLGRLSIGIEKDERYAEIAAKRLSQSLLPFSGLAGAR